MFFATMEQLKINALDINEKEFLQSINQILLLNIDVSFLGTYFALIDIAQYQHIQERVYREIDVALNGQPPSTFADLDKKLPFMEMVLKESSRVHPVLAFTLPEKTVKP
ncbi:cytochrome P450, partial [Salmonella sp. s54925]|uniref:cytochrome P450 n=1 Tax=Salmonella sp. s54925 TaxID=3159674 RepID=UPI003980677D